MVEFNGKQLKNNTNIPDDLLQAMLSIAVPVKNQIPVDDIDPAELFKPKEPIRREDVEEEYADIIAEFGWEDE